MALSVWGGKGKLVFLDLNFFIKYLFFYSRLCESLTQTCGPEYEIQQCYNHCCYCYSKWRGFGFGSATTTQRKQGPTRLTSHLTGLKIRAVRLQQIIQTTLFGGQTESEHTCSVSKNPSLHRKKKLCAHDYRKNGRSKLKQEVGLPTVRLLFPLPDTFVLPVGLFLSIF